MMTAAGRPSDVDVERSDGELVDALIRGELAALDELYSRYASLAYGLALRITPDSGRAEAVVLAAFMSLWSDRAAPNGGTDAVRLRLVQLVARAATTDVRVPWPRQSPGAIEPLPGLAMTHRQAGIAQGS